VRALKHHGGVLPADLPRPDVAAVGRGFDNLAAHLASAKQFDRPVIVAVNRFAGDAPEELAAVQDFCRAQGVPCAVADVFAQGGEGAGELARILVGALPAVTPPLPFLYDLEETVERKLHAIATRVYGAADVRLTEEAKAKLALFAKGGFHRLPICMAKTQDSLTDDPNIPGRPRGFTITVRDFEIANGAGYLVALTGKMMRMPALPRLPAAEHIDVAADGTITGI
jgi:formate--tetrahydrofolate ligase